MNGSSLQQSMVMNQPGGPVGAPPGQAQDFSHLQQPGQPQNGPVDVTVHLNTFIYDYFLRKGNWDLARMFLDKFPCKTSNEKRTNGDGKNGRPDNLPDADTGADPSSGDQPLLESWWQCFWDMYFVARGKPSINPLHREYLRQQKMRQQQGANNPLLGAARGMGQYQMMNGMAKNMQNRPGALDMQNKMMGQQMQRDPSGMDMNGQRPQTPGGDNAPSPSKRPRLENGTPFDAQGMANRQVSANQQLVAQMGPNGQQQLMQQNGMYAGQMKLEGMNGMQTPMGGHPADGGENRHALQDYQMQLMLLEQQNKKRLMQANRDRDQTGPGGTPGGVYTAPNMSPSGSRGGGGPSPTPNDQIKRMSATPKMQQQAISAGSPMPDMNRGSPAPNFDPNVAGGMPQQYYPNMAANQMGRAPSSHPQFNMANMNPQQMADMQRMQAANGQRLQNGQPWPQGVNPAMQVQNPGMRGQQQVMGPPRAPANEAAPVPRAQPSSPAQPPAPPTPSQTNAKPPGKGKKETAPKQKKATAKKNSTAGATPAADTSEPPNSTPNTPMTPMHTTAFTKAPNVQQTATANVQPNNAIPQPLSDGVFSLDAESNGYSLESADFGSADVLENFDFDSFLHTDDGNSFGDVGFLDTISGEV